jgi:hypothetical protein
MTNPPYHAPFSIWPSRILICPIWQGTRPLPVLDAGEGEVGREAAKARRGAASVPCSQRESTWARQAKMAKGAVDHSFVITTVWPTSRDGG